MMKKVILMLMAGAVLCACEKAIEAEPAADASEVVTGADGKTVSGKKFTFTLKGDFSGEWKEVSKAPRRTVGYLSADGKDMTDVWVLDYMNGQLVQQLHQSDNTADDFGKPVMSLAYGSHHVYFIASRGASPLLNTENHTIAFSTVRDTFYKDYEVDVVSTSNGNRAVTLDRVVTKLRLVFSDAIPADAATFNVTPATWYYGWNYVTAEPCNAASSQTVTVNIPSTSIGVSGESVNIYGFSTATEWTTDVTLSGQTAEHAVLGAATISDVPFKANRVSAFTGPLFGSGGTLSLSLNSTWNTEYEGTW